MFNLLLTEEEVAAILHVGDRYCWSAALSSVQEGTNEFTPRQANALAEAFEADTEGRHEMFPMLVKGSPLRAKLVTLYHMIVGT